MKTKEVIKEMFSKIKSSWYMPVTEYQVYSAEEQKVGVWTDGKPLYRKTITNLTSKNGWVIVYTQENADMLRVVACDVNISDETNDWLPATYQATSSSRACYSIKGNSIKFEMSAFGENKPVRLIIEYTKTTDSPETTKVPFEPLVEYSTEEKMIGYWVDGKPVYRRIINLPNVARVNANAWGNICDVSQYNIGSLVNARFISGDKYIVCVEHIDASDGMLKGYANGNAAYSIITIILEYTKTTD